MEPPVVPFDLTRMFLGDAPALFYLEIVVRCLIIYLYTLLVLRWIGGRSVAQLSLVEFLLVIALGSAVGDGLFYPEVPILHALAVVTGIALINKVLDAMIMRWTVAKTVLDGGPLEVVRQGAICHDAIRARAMGTAEMKAMLREAGVRNLGEVEAAYVEAGGKVSVFRLDRVRPGLRIQPPAELEPHQAVEPPSGEVCCTNCGQVAMAGSTDQLPRCGCGHAHWTRPE
jgi:uncharacterized membrane protein YcaP (DUF421 family)